MSRYFHPAQRLRKHVIVLSIAFALTELIDLSYIASAYAQSSATRQWDLPARPLAETLARIARESGYRLSADPALVQGKMSGPVVGNYTPVEAARRAVAGNALALVVTDSGTLTIQETTYDEATLPEIAVQAAAQTGTTEGTDSYTTRSMHTATKFNLSARETPQSVSVVTRQQMDDRGFQTLDEVAQDATGLSTRQIGGGERTQFFSRGFEVNTFLADGVPLSFDYDTQGVANMAMYDRVEVIRGAAGIITGTGNPSGAINLVRKRPTRETQVLLTGSGGSWNNYRGELDVSGALNEDGTVRGRAVVAMQDTDTFKKAYRHERKMVYGTIDMDLGRSTLLSVGGYYNKEDNPGADWNGLPTKRNGDFYQFDRSTRMTPDWAYWNKDNSSIFAELEHRFENGWKGTVTARGLQTKMDMQGTYLYLKPDSEDFGQGAGAYAYKKNQFSIDAYASGPFSLLGRTHELVVGASYRETKEDDGPGGWPSDYDEYVDPNTWDSGAVPKPAFNYVWSRKGHQKQYGAYATTRLNLADSLTLMLGARTDFYEYKMHLVSGTWIDDSGYKVDNNITPYAGLVYALDNNHSLYTSWTSVFRPQNYDAQNGGLLDPVTGSNLEAGVKGEYYDGKLTASAAVFQINQKNLPLELLPTECRDSAVPCYTQAGEVRSRGVEFEVAGAITPNWQVMTGYTFNTSVYVNDSDAGKAGTRYDTETPKHLMKFSTSYQLPGAFSQWRIGGAMRVRSQTDKPLYSIRQGGYTIVDLMASYRVSKNLDLRLNLNNVFDKYYYQTIGSTQDNNHFGAPRNFLITATYRF